MDHLPKNVTGRPHLQQLFAGGHLQERPLNNIPPTSMLSGGVSYAITTGSNSMISRILLLYIHIHRRRDYGTHQIVAMARLLRLPTIK